MCARTYLCVCGHRCVCARQCATRIVTTSKTAGICTSSGLERYVFKSFKVKFPFHVFWWNKVNDVNIDKTIVIDVSPPSTYIFGPRTLHWTNATLRRLFWVQSQDRQRRQPPGNNHLESLGWCKYIYISLFTTRG